MHFIRVFLCLPFVMIFMLIGHENAFCQETHDGRNRTDLLGHLELADFLIEPSFLISESSQPARDVHPGFGVGSSFLAIQWQGIRSFSGRVALGSYDLLAQPSWVSAPQSGFGLIEAYAQVDTAYGTLQAGLIPVYFGLDGSTPETLTWFPRSELYSHGLLPLRDMGVHYSISDHGLFTNVTVHNGEGGRDNDRRYWQTARWGWTGTGHTMAGVSGSTGRYNLSPYVQETKVYMVNLFLALDFHEVGISAEGTRGESRSLETSRFQDWYVQIFHNIGYQWGVLARYEDFDPSDKITNDSIKKASAGIYLKNASNSSRLQFLFTKKMEENERANDEYLLIWKISSAVLN